MGSALTVPLTDGGNKVRLWFTEYDLRIWELVSRGKEHPRIGVKLPGNIELYRPEELANVLDGADYVIMAVSSRGVLPVSERIRDLVEGRNIPVIIVSKGIEVIDDRVLTMTEIVKEYAGTDITVYVSGPSLAVELARRKPTFVVYSSKHIDIARRIKDDFETDYYRIEISDDTLGAEIAAALKNIYAIAYGIVEGMSKRANEIFNNLKAAIIAKALKEMAGIVQACGGKRETVYGLSGIGDLYVTAMGGRNSMFGQLIGSGMSVQEALKEMERRGVGVVEGYRNADTLAKYIAGKGVKKEEARLFYAVYSILYENAPREHVIEALK